MTIICPQKKSKLTHFLIAFFAILLVGGALSINVNGSLVEKNHELETLKQQIVELKIANADLKNEYYSITDPARLESIASDSGLTIEKRPQYITSVRKRSKSDRFGAIEITMMHRRRNKQKLLLTG